MVKDNSDNLKSVAGSKGPQAAEGIENEQVPVAAQDDELTADKDPLIQEDRINEGNQHHEKRTELDQVSEGVDIGKLSDKSKVLIGFIVTLFFSVLGFFFSYYAGLSKPRIDIVEIGLSGSNSGGRIEVGSSTVRKSEYTIGIPSLARFESFEKLVDIDQIASVEIARIDNALAAIDNWYRSYSSLNNSNLEEHPLREPFLNQYFIYGVRAQFIDVDKIFPDSVIDDLSNRDPKLPFLAGTDEGRQVLILSFGNASWQLSFQPDLDQGYLIRGVTGLAYSVATHDYDLIKLVTDETKNWLVSQKSNLVDVRSDIRDLVLPNSAFSVRVNVSNTGGTAFVVRPYVVLDILNSDLDGLGILLEPRIKGSAENPFRLTEGGFSIDIDPSTRSGSEVIVDTFLPDGQASAHTIVSPGSSETIDLVGVRVLGDDAEKFMGLMAGEALSVVVTAMSVEERRITSADFTFRTTLRNNVVQQLISEYVN